MTRIWSITAWSHAALFYDYTVQPVSGIDERKLRWRIRYHRKARTLHSDTLAELDAWKAEGAYSWCKNLRSEKQLLEEMKQKQTRIDPEDEHWYKYMSSTMETVASTVNS